MQDPRVPDGRYFDGYWQRAYTVLAMWSGVQRGSTGWMRVRWQDGHTTQHCTAWDPRRDQILAQARDTPMGDQ